MNIIDYIANDGYIIVNKEIARCLGLEEAVMLGELASKYKYWNDKNLLDEEGFFFATAEDIEHQTSLSAYKQRTAFKNLESKGIIETKFKGVPPKKYFKINVKNLESYLSNSLTVNPKKIKELTLKNFDTNNNINNNNINNNTYNASKDAVVETSSTTNTNRGELLNFSETNSDINKPVKNLTNKDSVLVNNENINVDKAADPAPKKDPGKSRGYKALMEYIDATTYSFETKEELKKWYNEVGKGKVSVNQLRDKLKDLYEQVGGDEVKTREAIHRSYINSYMAFYPVKSNNTFNNSGKLDTIHISHKVSEQQKKGFETPLDKSNYKNDTTRDFLTADSEFEAEVKAGNIKGVGIDEKGRIYF